MAKKSKKGQAEKVVKLESLKQINLHAAGLDIGSEEIWACVPEEGEEVAVRSFETFTIDLHRLTDWLQEKGIETVAMEATGVYWIPIYEILEERGLEVYLINARHIKNVPGKKTDVLDCQWIQQLHTYGLLRASFRPEADMVALRSYIRHRDNLVRYRSVHIQHMQKALELMNLKLNNVISDITGQTGLKIIRAIIAGEHDPVKLAQYRNNRCRSSEDEIAKALTGHYLPEHLFALKQAVELYDFYNQQIEGCDVEIESKYTAFKPVLDVEANPLPPSTSRRRSKNEPQFNLRQSLYQITGVDLTQIDGLQALSVQQIIAETGVDMDKWPTAKHFTSWLTLAPHNDISGGKVLKSKTLKSKNRAAQAFRMAAQSVSRSDSALGAFFRRMRAKHGAPKAITATAHKIARIFYHLLKHKLVYKDPGQDYYTQQHQDRIVKNLKRKAKALGFDLVPQPVVS